MKKITAYKAFDKEFKCRDYQFKVGQEYTHNGKIQICNSGFHSCEYPMDIWRYYDIMESRFAVVEASGDIEKHDEDSKVCSSKLHIKAEIELPQLIKASIDWHFNGWFKKAKKDGKKAAEKPNSNLAASGYGSNLAASGNYSNLAASGNDSKLAASGYGSKLAASGGGSNVIVSAEKDIMVKGSINTFICLTHYVENKPKGFVTGQIGKKGLKPDTWYKLSNAGKLVKA